MPTGRPAGDGQRPGRAGGPLAWCPGGRQPARRPPGMDPLRGRPLAGAPRPIFDFTVTPPGHAWLDDLARDVADVLGPRGEPEVIDHGDWYCGNLRFVGTELGAAWDCDSPTAHHEPVLAGVAAGDHTDGSAAGAAAPAPEEVAAFLAAFGECRVAPFTKSELATATARGGLGDGLQHPLPARHGAPGSWTPGRARSCGGSRGSATATSGCCGTPAEPGSACRFRPRWCVFGGVGWR